MRTIKILLITALFFSLADLRAADGYALWLGYSRLPEPMATRYREQLTGYLVHGNSPTLTVVRNELQTGISSMLGTPFPELPDHPSTVNLLVGLGGSCQELSSGAIVSALKKVGTEGYLLKMVRQSGKQLLVIAANSEKGLLYGTYRLLLQIKCGTDLNGLSIRSAPKIKVRILNHWDNLNGSIERGYAGQSLWKWSELPDKKDARYTDYARANASIGINATVLNNVNANPEMLTPPYLKKVAALADLFRPYGIKVFLSVKFSSPINIGGMGTADPLDPAVRQWWKQKVTEVYSYIPDFGGFLVKANSEGQPGPQNYHRSHADGANMLAEALQPFGGIVMWRAFVYDNNVPDDRAKQALNEFKPLDGKFAANVLVQVKNGAIDFQPREPFHPMFGMMPKTPLMMEFQITQEYLGQSTDLCYLAPLYRECLESDTYARGKHSTVSKVIDGSLEHHALTGIAGVANTGDDRNWTGHLFGQANWYAFGRLAWNPEESSEGIASDWIRLTLSMEPEVVSTIQKIMMGSRENGVNYMTPLGLHHIMGYNHHFGPAPWVNRGRADWTCIYYHKADSAGIGFDRSPTGSNATGQYAPKVGRRFADPSTCPEKYLLWFHHLPWNYQMKSGRTLWDELNLHYADGVAAVGRMGSEWQSLRGKIDPDLFAQVALKLEKQEKLARWWRNSCVLYFQQYARMPIPEGVPQPDQTLEECKKFDFKELK